MKDQAYQCKIAVYNKYNDHSVIGDGYTLQQAKDNLWKKIKSNNSYYSYYGTPCVSLKEWVYSPDWDNNWCIEITYCNKEVLFE